MQLDVDKWSNSVNTEKKNRVKKQVTAYLCKNSFRKEKSDF